MVLQHPNYSTSRSREEVFAEDNFINPLPRAVVRPNSPVLLDGEWNFAVDHEDKGIQEKWFLGYKYDDTAHWPGAIEAHMDKAKGQPTVWRDKIVAWYEREFPLPQRVN